MRAGPARRAPARHAHGRRLRLSRRPAAAAVRRLGPRGRELRRARGLPAAARPRLGALRLRQGAARLRGRAGFNDLYRDVLRPFVYRRYLDFGVFESLREMKELIAREVERRELQQQRQARARRHPRDRVHRPGVPADARRQHARLQTRSLLEALPQLAGQKLLPADAVAELLGGLSLPAPRREPPAGVERRADARAAGRRARARAARARDGTARLA